MKLGDTENSVKKRLWVMCTAALGAAALAVACSSDKNVEGSTLPGPDSGGGGGGASGGGGAGGTGGGADGGRGNIGGGFVMPSMDGGMADANCGESPFDATRKKVSILLLIDKSRSMESQPEGYDTDKWSAMTAAINAAVGAAEDDVAFGLELFPGSTSDGGAVSECEVPPGDALSVGVDVASANAPLIEAELDAVTPSGLTPTASALARALEYFTNGAGASLDGDKYVLLATDGGPNCDDALLEAAETCDADACTTNLDGECCIPDGSGGCDPIPGVDNCCDTASSGAGAGKFCLDAEGPTAEIEALAKAGIPTFVVGIPGSRPYADVLNALAQAGGVPASDGDTDYFEVSATGGVAELAEVFSEITTELIRTCELKLDEEPEDRGLLNVEIDGRRLNRDEDGPDGWRLEGPTTEPPTVVIQGADCQALKAEGAKSINVVFGCESQRGPR